MEGHNAIYENYAELTKMPHGTSKDRTEKNIQDSVATHILTKGKATNGTALSRLSRLSRTYAFVFLVL